MTQLFTGDCLFPSWRREDVAARRFEQLLDDVAPAGCSTSADDSTVVYPGHDDNATLGARHAPAGVAGTRLVTLGAT